MNTRRELLGLSYILGSEQEQAIIAKAESMQGNHPAAKAARSEAAVVRDAIRLRRVRAAIAGVGVIGGPTIGGFLLKDKISPPHPVQDDEAYVDLASYREKDLPSEMSLRLAKDMQAQAEYPSLIRAGGLITELINQPGNLPKYTNLLLPQADFGLRVSSDISPAVAKFNQFGVNLYIDPVNTKRKDGSDAIIMTGHKIDTTAKMHVRLSVNSGLFDKKVSPMTFRFAYAKEVSHLLLENDLQAMVIDDLKQKVAVPKDEEDSIFRASLSASKWVNNPNIDKSTETYPESFLKSQFWLDCGAFWYVLPDFMKALHTGKLTEQDVVQLAVGANAGKEAIQKGLLVKSGNSYNFNVGPLSSEWLTIMGNNFYSTELK